MRSVTNIVTTVARAIDDVVRPVPFLSPKDAYRLWAPTYDDQSDNAILQLEEQTVLPIFDDVGLAGRSVIDLGCGTGRHVRHILERGAKQIVGMDLSEEMLSVARQRIRSPKVDFIQAEFRHIPVTDEQFDCAVASLALSHEEHLEGALQEFRRILKPGSTLIITDLHWSFESRGWKRTFKSKGPHGRPFAVRNITHDLPEYQKAYQRTMFSVEHQSEPVLDASLLPVFERTNMLKTYQRYVGEPLLATFRLRRL